MKLVTYIAEQWDKRAGVFTEHIAKRIGIVGTVDKKLTLDLVEYAYRRGIQDAMDLANKMHGDTEDDETGA